MRFLHLGDLHLGRSLCEFDLIEDQQFILDQIFTLAVEKQVDGVLIAGDVYDKAVPSEAAVRLLDHFLCRLSEAGIRVFLISGNHDSDDRLNFGSSLLEKSGVHISSVFDGGLYQYQTQDSYGELTIYLLPFVKASQVRHYFPEETIDTYEDAVRVVLSHAELDPEKRNVLVAHQFVTGDGALGRYAQVEPEKGTEEEQPLEKGTEEEQSLEEGTEEEQPLEEGTEEEQSLENGSDPELGGSEGLGVQSVGLVEKISYTLFDAFDYVALGHIHSPQRVGRETVRYAGSPLKYSLSEVHNAKSVPLVTIQNKGEVTVELVPLRPLRNLRHEKGKLAALLDKTAVREPQDFLYLTLTDEEFQNNAMGIARQVYPNVLKIDYDNSYTKSVEQVDISKFAQNKSFSELIREFYRMIYNCEISEEEMDYMRMAAREAGVLHEAD